MDMCPWRNFLSNLTIRHTHLALLSTNPDSPCFHKSPTLSSNALGAQHDKVLPRKKDDDLCMCTFFWKKIIFIQSTKKEKKKMVNMGVNEKQKLLLMTNFSFVIFFLCLTCDRMDRARLWLDDNSFSFLLFFLFF